MSLSRPRPQFKKFINWPFVTLVLVLVVVAEVWFLTNRFRSNESLAFLAAVTPTVLAELVNSQREMVGLPPLAFSAALTQAALLKAQDMIQNHYFAHNSPSGLTPWHWLKQVGYDYRYAGENLAVNFIASSDVLRAWLNSPSHRDNIESDWFSETGIAALPGVYKGRKAVFVVQFFGRPRILSQEPLAVRAPARGSLTANSALAGLVDSFRARLFSGIVVPEERAVSINP